MDTPILETARLILRDWRVSDQESCVQMNSDPEVMKNFPRSHTREESIAFMVRANTMLAKDRYGYWAVEERSTGDLLGFVALADPKLGLFPGAIEIGWRFRKHAWGKGFASEGARKLLEYGFESLDLTEIISLTAKVNERSWRVMERIGMQRDFANDFDHPRVPEGSHLRPHLIYRIKRDDWRRSRA